MFAACILIYNAILRYWFGSMVIFFLWKQFIEYRSYFLANINSTGDNPELVLGFGVTRYTLKNDRISTTEWFPSDFFDARLKVSTNLSAFLLGRG